MARGQQGGKALASFREELRKSLLVAFACFFISLSAKLAAEQDMITRQVLTNSIRWFATAIMEWHCDECIGGVKAAKPPPKKRKYLKKSKRTNRTPSPKKTDDTAKTTRGKVGFLGRRSSYKLEGVMKGTFGGSPKSTSRGLPRL